MSEAEWMMKVGILFKHDYGLNPEDWKDHIVTMYDYRIFTPEQFVEQLVNKYGLGKISHDSVGSGELDED